MPDSEPGLHWPRRGPAVVAVAILGGAGILWVGFAIPSYEQGDPMLMFALGGVGLLAFIVAFPDVFIGLFMSRILFASLLLGAPILNAASGWSLLLLLAAGTHYLLRKPARFRLPWGPLVASVVLLAVLLFLGTWRSPSHEQGIVKAWQFLYWNLTPFMVPLVFVREPRRLKQIVNALLIGSLLFAIPSLIRGETLGGTRLFFDAAHADPILLGRVSGLATVLLLSRMIGARIRHQLLLLPLVGVLLYIALATGTRGVFLALLGALLTLGFVYPQLRGRRHIRLDIFLIFVLGLIAVTFMALPESTQDRLLLPYLEGLRGSAATRLDNFQLAWSQFISAPLFGTGTASFGHVLSYPHNIILEIAAELGLIGLFAFSAFVILTAKYSLQVCLGQSYPEWARSLMVGLLSAFVFFFAEAQVSGNILLNQQLWFLSGLIWAVYLTAKGEGEEAIVAPMETNPR